jgi:hypothetical protein
MLETFFTTSEPFTEVAEPLAGTPAVSIATRDWREARLE